MQNICKLYLIFYDNGIIIINASHLQFFLFIGDVGFEERISNEI